MKLMSQLKEINDAGSRCLWCRPVVDGRDLTLRVRYKLLTAVFAGLLIASIADWPLRYLALALLATGLTGLLTRLARDNQFVSFAAVLSIEAAGFYLYYFIFRKFFPLFHDQYQQDLILEPLIVAILFAASLILHTATAVVLLGQLGSAALRPSSA